MPRPTQNKQYAKTQEIAYLAIGLSVLSMLVSWGVEFLARQIFFTG